MAGTGNHPLWEPRMWQGQVWEARPDGESTRGKAKFGKRHGSRKWEEENSSTRRRYRGKGRKRQKTPSPAYNVPLTPLGIGRAGCFLLLCISQTPEMHPRPFFGCFWHPQWSFARVLPHPQGASAGIRACVGRYVNQNGCFSGPCLATLLPRLIEIARACNHLQFYRRPWCQRFYRDFIAPLPCESTSAAWQLFSELGLEPNHTGWTAQSLFFLEESCREKHSDTQTFSNFSNYFKRVLKL